MKKIVYLANSFPEPGESYVWEEVRELRRRGQQVATCAYRRPRKLAPELQPFERETRYILPLKPTLVVKAAAFLFAKLHLILDLLWRVLRRPEPISCRFRALAHTWFGAYLAVALRKDNIVHIHVHHGYFSAWIGMVAARFLNASFSLTLHGSDLLVRASYLDCKLEKCQFCVTISEFNRGYIVRNYPSIERTKILVHRLGVDATSWLPARKASSNAPFSILSVGRLHPVKNHAFLIRACRELARAGADFRCVIAGSGEEHERLLSMVRQFGLQNRVELRGQVQRERLWELYRDADVIVFTSRSEGIPLAAMEAMAMERIVLAPKITGVPELIEDGRTGFLYEPESLDDFLTKLLHIRAEQSRLDDVRRAARERVANDFNLQRNLELFAADFLHHVYVHDATGQLNHASSVLQQI